MNDPRASVFWQSAVRSGLLDAPKLEACLEAVPPEKRTPDAIDRRMARQAVNSGLLTLWQAQQLLAGRYQGLRIDRYELQELIGQGGMGRVYLARDSRLRRPVALKILSRERISNPRALARFRREARVGAQLQHENLVRVYDEGEANGVRYLVMEYIAGQTVGKMISEQGRLPYALAADLTRQVSLGLEHLHQKGLLHRDVNPMNILVDRDGTAKLTDLGLAIDPGDEEDEVVTRDGATVGTFDYISPEQARHSRQVDTRSDIYSLGCALFQMISGRVPFPAPSLPEKLFAHQSTPAESLTKLVPGVPEGLDAVVRKMMSKRPEDRYARPKEVARALEPFAAGLGVEPLEESTVPPTTQGGRTGSATVVDNNGSPTVDLPSNSDPDLATPAVMRAPAAAAAATVGARAPGGGGVGVGLGSDSSSGGGTGSATSPDPSAGSGSESGSGTEPGDWLKIDLGPQPSLSESLSGTRSRDDEPPRFETRQLLFVLVGVALLGAVVILLSGWFGRGGGSGGHPKKSDSAANKPAEEAKPVPAAKSDISVVYANGDVFEAEDLQEAIRLAVGKPADVVLRNDKPIALKVSAPIQFSGGLRIRAEPGKMPVVSITFEAPVPFLMIVGDGSLAISGVTFRVEAAPPATPDGPTLIRSGGGVGLARCAFAASPAAGSATLIDGEGGRIHLQGCWVEGFAHPINLAVSPGSESRLEQTMIVRTAPVEGGASWAIAVHELGSFPGKAARLVIDHCTIVGDGLLQGTGFVASTPLEVKVNQSVVVAKAMLAWDGPFPGGLRWAGQGNLYEITGDAWVVGSPAGSQAVPEGPTSLQSWANGPISEPGTRAIDLGFTDDPTTEGLAPADFKLLNVDPPHPGAAAALVGPTATP